MSNKQNQDVQSSYMDGVRVKISEKYKPPPKINLGVSYSQRLSLNKQIQNNRPSYDFDRDLSIREKMREWKEARDSIKANLSESLKRKKEEWSLKLQEKLEKDKEVSAKKSNETVNSCLNQTNIDNNRDENYTGGRVLIPIQVNTNNYSNYTNILTPMPISQSNPCSVNLNDTSPINISDFEQDTCSPFDNMELKSINDMEELKLVLQNNEKRTNLQANYQPVTTQYTSQEQPFYYNTTASTAHSSNQNIFTHTNGYNYYPDTLQPFNTYNYNREAYDSNKQSIIIQTVAEKNPLKSVPDIMKALETQLNSTYLENKTSTPSHSNLIRESSPNIIQSSNIDNLENPYEFLPKNLQTICNLTASMGFPLARVARACQEIGDDQKKIVEHLLALTELLDLGFPEKNVSSALLQCNNDRDKALELLIL